MILRIHRLFRKKQPSRPACFAFFLLSATLFSLAAQTPAPPPASASRPASTTGVQPIPLTASPGRDIAAHRKSIDAVRIAAGDWQPTGMQLFAGDRIEFHAAGAIALSDGRTATPAGLARGWKDLLRLYPMSTANNGELIGRIGKGEAALPFRVGKSSTLTVPSDGELYLRANLSPDLTPNGKYSDGKYSVRIDLHPDAIANPSPVNPASPANPSPASQPSQSFASLLSPQLFADIPRRVRDRQGNLGDMVNFALVGTGQQVQASLAKAGWFPTDANSQDALVHGLVETLARKSYMAVPMSTLFLFGRPQDMAYARANAIEVAATRNHLRLWKTTESVDGLPLWVGSATHDHGFETDRRTGGITHRIDPDIDREREFILASLNDAGAVQAAAYVRPANPVGSARTATGGTFTSDGRIAVILLR